MTYYTLHPHHCVNQTDVCNFSVPVLKLCELALNTNVCRLLIPGTARRDILTLHDVRRTTAPQHTRAQLQGSDVDVVGTKTLRPDWQVSVRANCF